MRLLMIIPAYNEEDNIVHVVKNIREKYPEYDYVVVNDGSTDHTSRRCHREGFEIIDLPTNIGLAGAFQAGLKYAYSRGYDCALQFDADGQHKPEYIEGMLKKMSEGYDIVIGSRFVTKRKEKGLRMIGARILTVVIKLTTGKRISDPTSGMRMFNKNMIKEFAVNVNYGPEPDTISYLLNNGASIAEVQVEMDERVNGDSYLNLSRSAMYMFRMLVSILFIQNFRKRDTRHVIMKRNS